MIKSKHKIRRSFTLMEVIVAMAVFSVMMGLLLQMFLGTQKLWTESDNKNELYSDARVAMDLFASTLQSQYYDPGSSMFLFGTGNNGGDDAVFFPVKMPVDYGSGEEIYYLSVIWRNTDHTLYMRTLGKRHNRAAYDAAFAQTSHNTTNVNSKENILRNQWLAYDSNQSQKVIGGVMSLSFRPVHAYPGNSSPVTFYRPNQVGDTMTVRGTSMDTREISPFAVQIIMDMLSKRHYDEWVTLGGTLSPESAAAQQFRLANTRRFERIIYLGFK